jgi:aromatic ring-opening dioxygenase LigB subunit
MIVVVPHPPILISDIGGTQAQAAPDSVDAMRRIAERVKGADPETVIIVSPHAPISPDAFGIHVGDVLRGSFAHFGCAWLSFRCENDLQLVDEIISEAYDQKIKIFEIPDPTPLDHGVLVPLFFLLQAGWKGKIVALSCSLVSNQQHLAYGGCIERAVRAVSRRTVFVASADLSHRLTETAPDGYDAKARQFDGQVVSSIRDGDFRGLADIDASVCQRASECGYRPILISLGVAQMQPANNRVLSYEHPFGVGYLVAVLADQAGG